MQRICKVLVVYVIGDDNEDDKAFSFFLKNGLIRSDNQCYSDNHVSYHPTYMFLTSERKDNGKRINTIRRTLSESFSGNKDIYKIDTYWKPSNKDNQGRNKNDDMFSKWAVGLRQTHGINFDLVIFMSTNVIGPFFPWWSYGDANINGSVSPNWCHLYASKLSKGPNNQTGGIIIPLPTDFNISKIQMIMMTKSAYEYIYPYIFCDAIVDDQRTHITKQAFMFSLLQRNDFDTLTFVDKVLDTSFLDTIPSKQCKQYIKINGEIGTHPYESLFVPRLPFISTPKPSDSFYLKKYPVWHGNVPDWEGVKGHRSLERNDTYPQTTKNTNTPEDRVLIIWAGHQITHALDVFLKHGIIQNPNYDFVIVFNIASKVDRINITEGLFVDAVRQPFIEELTGNNDNRSDRARVSIVFRSPSNTGNDFGMWSYVLLDWGPKNGRDWKGYSYCIMMNQTVVGPFFPQWYNEDSGLADWIRLFTLKLKNNKVSRSGDKSMHFDMLGLTCNKNQFFGTTSPHIQSMFMCFTKETLSLAIESKIFVYPFKTRGKVSLIENHEIRLGTIIREKGLEMTDMLAWTKYERCTGKNKYPYLYSEKGFSGASYIHPLETVFFKRAYWERGVDKMVQAFDSVYLRQ